MQVPNDLLYSKEHEWVLVEGDTATIGITDHAQSELGDVVYVELPETAPLQSSGDSFGTVESVKAVSEVYLPIDGDIIETNSDLEDAPEKVNDDPYGDGWMIKVRISDTSQLEELLSPEDYVQYVQEETAE